MSDQDVLRKILDRLGRSEFYNEVAASPQTEFNDGKLISIDISDLQLNFLPEDLFEGAEELERIHISFNNIEDLPENIFNDLSNLKVLNFYSNNLKSLPDNIFEGLDNIEWIDLRSNNLEALPKSLGKATTLNYLFLQKNPLSEHSEYNWAADYHSKRDIRKFMPEFQEAMGLEVTMEKPLSRREIAERERKKREQKQKKAKKKKQEKEEKEEEEEED